MAQSGAVEKGYDPMFGARSLKRFLQRQLETRLACALLAGEVYPPEEGREYSSVTFKAKGDELMMG